MKSYLSLANAIVIAVTFILFGLAFFAKGIAEELLLEAGVLLVSVKLILINQKNAATNKAISKELIEIKESFLNLSVREK